MDHKTKWCTVCSVVYCLLCFSELKWMCKKRSTQDTDEAHLHSSEQRLMWTQTFPADASFSTTRRASPTQWTDTQERLNQTWQPRYLQATSSHWHLIHLLKYWCKGWPGVPPSRMRHSERPWKGEKPLVLQRQIMEEQWSYYAACKLSLSSCERVTWWNAAH